MLDNKPVEEIVEEESKPQTKPITEPVAPTQPKKKGKRKPFYEYTLENDIRYKAPLSYRYLRIIAWLSIAVAMGSSILEIAIKHNGEMQGFSVLQVVLSLFNVIATPLFLLANFSLILKERETYKQALIKFGLGALGIIAGFYIIYFHFIVGLGQVILGSAKETELTIEGLINAFSTSGYFEFNVMLDLFLCTLFAYFINAKPKKFFQGKKIYFFRLLCLLPVIYEAAMIVLKFLSANDVLLLPLYVYPLLPTKPPFTFIAFIILTLFIKNRERIYINHGKTAEEYSQFLKTNANSLQFSVFTTVIFAVCAIVDLIITVAIAITISVNAATPELGNQGVEALLKCGMGKSLSLIFITPFILLFSYTKTHKNKLIDTIIPVAGIAVIALVLIEGGFQLVLMLIQGAGA